VGIIVLLFAVFTGPFIIYMFLTLFNFHLPFVPFSILAGLASVNSALNPVIYAWRIDPLRNGFKMIFQKCITRPKNY
jgi:hypothetical protein